tara:strand:- start:10990 stop:11904 length:915 start_codon:yes stop_codon:yes gene_type:complete
MVFKHKIVNDLAWVIYSAPLMSSNPGEKAYLGLDDQWFKKEVERCEIFLKAEDADPSRLAKFVSCEGIQLLGKRFERFVEYWLTFSGKYEVLISNRPVSRNKITLGEIDYVIRDIFSGEIFHLEVAAKYYLGHNNSSLWSNWKGINAKDALEDKMTKFRKQLTIFDREEGVALLNELGLTRPRSLLMMKGFFFYYWRNIKCPKSPQLSLSNHNAGLFLKESEISEFFKGDNSWALLSKHNWFAPYVSSSSEELYSEIGVQAKIRSLLKEYNVEVMLAKLSYENGHFIETLRVAVVLNKWPNRER